MVWIGCSQRSPGDGSEVDSGTHRKTEGPIWRFVGIDYKLHGLTRPSVEDPNPILDLTALLNTGRASESLQDFLSSSEQMSERVSALCLCPFTLILSYRVSKNGSLLWQNH